MNYQSLEEERKVVVELVRSTRFQMKFFELSKSFIVFSLFPHFRNGIFAEQMKIDIFSILLMLNDSRCV